MTIESKMNISKTSPFGSEINGLNITDVRAKDIGDLKNILAHNGLIVFRQQTATDRDFVDFLGRLGSLTFTIGETPVADRPELNIVSNIGRTSPPRSVFHTDTSYISQPPAFTALRAVTIPTVGGETLFSDQYRAYDTLPKTVKQQLADVRVLHVATGVSPDERQESQSWHPLFKLHPISGRRSLFLSTPERCQEISGMAGDLARRILRLLYNHSIRHYRIYAHQWQPGDILLWDNRCTMHRAAHARVIGDRVLHRGIVLDRDL
jgi:taurine dioxygenase